MNKGMKVTLWYKGDVSAPRIMRNVTEVEYYMDEILGKMCVAFESDIHSTGMNLDVQQHVARFTVVEEDEVAVSFDD